MHLILASASPRRAQLLKDAGISFEIEASGIDEPEPTGPVDPAAYVVDLAWRKAREVARRRGKGLILAADTTCAVDGFLLNKPTDRNDAERMIRLQEGRHVEVVTGICLYRADRERWAGLVDCSVVALKEMTDEERGAYLDSGLWEGKAGAYGLQDEDSLATVVSGSWSNVVGLPVERLTELLRDPSWLL